MEPTHSAALDAINPQKATDKISEYNDHNFMSLWLKHDFEYDCKSCFFQVVASVNCDLMAGVITGLL